MEQTTEGRQEEVRRALARRRHWQVLRRLMKEGAQEGFLPRVGEVVGGVTLEERLGAGGFGTVFRARRGDTLFAVKLLYLPHVGRWALRELEVLLRLYHVGLVVVDSHGHHGHCPGFGPLFLYIVTGYVPGLPMDVWVERHNPEARWAARAVLTLAAQLWGAHSVGVFHRDVKPDNVVVREADGGAVLVDYGVGTFAGAPKVSRGLLPGSLQCRAPEAWRFLRERQPDEGYVASARDDLWALGVLFYWLLTGSLPFDGVLEAEMADAVLHDALVPPHVRNPRVPRALSDVCQRMLEKQPEARYPDAEAVCGALESALAGADASWEVPLCEAWGPDGATTHQEGWMNLEQALARNRRVLAREQDRPRRGRPATTLAATPEPLPGVDAPLSEEAEALVPPACEPPPVVADVPEVASVAPPRTTFRGWRGGMLVLGALALLATLALYFAPAPSREDSPPQAVPVLWATPASLVAWALSGQEVAPAWCPLDGDGGAAPAWAPTPAPVAFATLAKDSTRVKTQQQDSGTQEKQQRKGTVRNAVAKALCTATAGALAAGCPGAQVRDTPAPEACPPGSQEAMRRLGIEIGDDTGTAFLGVREPGFWPVREGPGAQLRLRRSVGEAGGGHGADGAPALRQGARVWPLHRGPSARWGDGPRLRGGVGLGLGLRAGPRARAQRYTRHRQGQRRPARQGGGALRVAECGGATWWERPGSTPEVPARVHHSGGSMPFSTPAALPLLVLLAGAAAAQPSTPPGEAAGAPRSIALRAKAPPEVPELYIGPGLLTTLLFGAPLTLAGVEVEEHEHFVRVRVLEDMLVLQPSGTLGTGKRPRLKVRFVEGTVPASADFVLVVDAARVQPQVNVELQPEVPSTCWREAEAERIQARQCQGELERERRRPDGLTGLLADSQLDMKGVAARTLTFERDVTQRPGQPLTVWDATSYRARGVVAVELWVTERVRAALDGGGGGAGGRGRRAAEGAAGVAAGAHCSGPGPAARGGGGRGNGDAGPGPLLPLAVAGRRGAGCFRGRGVLPVEGGSLLPATSSKKVPT